MSAERKQRTAAQVERARLYFDDHPGGVTREMFAHEIGVPQESISRLMAHLRRNATLIGRTAVALKIGGEWIYGWAETLNQHFSEHYKRRNNERRSLRLTIETLTQSLNEHPDSPELRRQLASANHRLEDIEIQMEELTGQLRLVRSEAA